MNYKVYQGDELKQTVTSKTAVINGLQPNRTYDFSVQPEDTQNVGGRTRYTHVAYADSADGSDGFYVGGGTNLLANSDQQFTGAGIDTGTGPEFLVIPFNLNDIFDKYGADRDYTLSFDLSSRDPSKANSIASYPYPGAPAPDKYMFDYVTHENVTTTPKRYSRIIHPTLQDATIKQTTLVFYGVYNTGNTPIVNRIKITLGTDSNTSWSPAPSEAHPTYIGTYTDLTQADSTNPSDYTWNPIQDGDAKRDGTKETISVTTRGIRFNIPKTLTVGSTIALRYEEYPLGIVPIGNEPSGYFGGGNKQNLSAKVISTANGSSVVEVGGNVIKVGGDNLLTNTNKDISITSHTTDVWPSWVNIDTGFSFEHSKTYTFSTEANNSTNKVSEASIRVWEDSTNTQVGIYAFPADGKRHSVTFTIPNDSHNYHLWFYAGHAGIIPGVDITTTYHHPKLEPGTIATPYASFVDGDTFTAQPDGTCALFGEYKALYY